MIDLNELAIHSYEVAQKRFSNNADLACLKHCATEVVEASFALDEVCTCNDVNCKKERFKEYVLELSDIIMCVLTICGKNNIDIEQALLACYNKNKDKVKE